jgi:predicted HTH domain antitoxin
MKVLTLNVPDNIELDNLQLAIIVSTRLYEQGKLSLGEAAELSGLTKKAFAEILSAYNISIFNYPASDLTSDVSNA